MQRTAANACAVLALASSLVSWAQHPVPSGPTVPVTTATALDGHTVTLPRDLSARATILILGFGRHSSDATTAWEKPVRTQLAHPPLIGFYDIAMIAEVPGFLRSTVTRMIRHQVPDVLRPNFLPLTENEAQWKQAAGYAADQPEAAYVLVVDGSGAVRWSTHAPFSAQAFATLQHTVEQVAGQGR